MNFKANTKEVTDALQKLSSILDNEIAKEVDKESDKIVKEAGNTHRYRSRTGNLVEATKKELKIDKKSIRALYSIDDVKAPYGKFIHDGFKSWNADTYLENAVMRNEKNIEKAADKGIGKAIKKVGL